MRVTIREVARQAGVSVATVSRVLNGSGPVREETSARIREVAARLRYTPNESARSLIRSRTSTLGVLLPDIWGDFFSEMIRGIDQRARQAGYHLLVSGSHDDLGEMEAALSLMRGRVDGMILMSPDITTQTLLAELPSDLPVVLINCAEAGPNVDTVNIDNVGGARAMVRHLIALGHRRIAIIGGAERNHDAAERLRGYREALAEAAIGPTPELEMVGDFTESSGYAAALALLAAHERPTAIFAANDSMAIGACGALRDEGVSVPRDIAICGFDDIPIARYITPSLTSVHVAIDELGRIATERLLHAIEHGNTHVRTQESLPSTLVIRASCGSVEDVDGSRSARGARPRFLPTEEARS